MVAFPAVPGRILGGFIMHTFHVLIQFFFDHVVGRVQHWAALYSPGIAIHDDCDGVSPATMVVS